VKLNPPDYGLEFLLAFDGRIHYLEEGYWIKFEIRRVEVTKRQPHGLAYSFTLHAPDGTRLVGFDNAHVPAKGSRFGRRPEVADHWHRTRDDPGRPYAFKDAAGLLDDFFGAVTKVLELRGMGTNVTRIDEIPRNK
jgi:hypothetical protein